MYKGLQLSFDVESFVGIEFDSIEKLHMLLNFFSKISLLKYVRYIEKNVNTAYGKKKKKYYFIMIIL